MGKNTGVNSSAELEYASLDQLMCSARELRAEYWGDTVTYSRKVFIPLTNMCRDSCGYCTFVQHPDSPNARFMSPEEVLVQLRAAEVIGCKEALFSLGEKPESRYTKAAELLAELGYKHTVDYLRDICELTLAETTLIPHVNAGALDWNDIEKLKPVSGSMGMMVENLSPRLMKKGGPHYRCPDKAPKMRLKTLRAVGEQQVPFTTGLLIGIGETLDERISTLEIINDIHRQYGHIQEVIVQNFRAKPGTVMAFADEPGKKEMLRTLAAARLVLDPSISLQAPPNLEEDYLCYLDAGINDWGGISPLTLDYINPERAWPDLKQLSDGVRGKGFNLQERLMVYPDYIRPLQKDVSSSLCSRLDAMSRDDGLAKVQWV